MNTTETCIRTGQRVRTRIFLKCLAMVLAGGFSLPAAAQEILKLELKKPAPEQIDRPRTFLEIHLPMDLDGLDLGTPFDEERSSLELMQDDQGHDLLAMHQEIKAQGSVKTPSGGVRAFSRPPPILQFGGVADESNNKNILLQVSVLAVPSSGATRIELAGRAVLNFIAESAPSELQLEDIQVKSDYGEQHFDSEIGPIGIRTRTMRSVGSNVFREYSVRSTENPLVGIEVIGGDDSGDYPLAHSGDILLKDPPRPVSLLIRYGKYEKREVPLELDFSIGM
jgi:hypothetical protein